MAVDGINVQNLTKQVVNNSFSVGVSGIGITGQSLISGTISFIPSGSIQLAYSGNNIVIGVPQSIGELWVSGNTVVTPIVAARAFAIVSGFSRTGALMKDFTMSSSGQMTYNGPSGFNGTASVMGEFQGAAGGDDLCPSFIKNGIALTTINRSFDVVATATNFSSQTSITLKPSDTIAFAIANNTDTTSPLVINYNFIVR